VPRLDEQVVVGGSDVDLATPEAHLVLGVVDPADGVASQEGRQTGARHAPVLDDDEGDVDRRGQCAEEDLEGIEAPPGAPHHHDLGGHFPHWTFR
jgi:hypothetical protein